MSLIIPVALKKNNASVLPFVGPMDSYTSDLAGLWSVSRRLLTSYTGPLIRVRRSSDDAELDIGNVGGALDQSALLSFVGGNSAYIRTVYDQSGVGINYIQTTNSKQFRIVNSGTVEQNEGVPAALAIAGSETFMNTTTTILGRTWSATANLISNIMYPGLVTGSSGIILIGSLPNQRFVSSNALTMRYNGVEYAFDTTPFPYLETGCCGLTTNADINEVNSWGSERGIAGRYFDGYIHEQAIYSTVPAFLNDVDAVLMDYLGIVP